MNGTSRISRCAGRVALAVASLCASSLAAEPPRRPSEPLASAADRRAATVLTTLSAEANAQATAQGWSSIAIGAVVTATGVFVDSEYDTTYAPILWIGGVAALAAGITTLLVQTPIEAFADEVGSSHAGLEARWRAKAEEARGKRTAMMLLNASLGVAGVATASTLAAGVGDLSRGDRAEWITMTALVGAASLGGALHGYLFESSIESGYRLAYPELKSAAAAPVRVGASPLANGGMLQLHGSF